MSHRHRHPEQSVFWRSAVDDSLRRCKATRSALLASSETPLGSYLIQAARRWQVPIVQLQLPIHNESAVEWSDRIKTIQHSRMARDRPTVSTDPGEPLSQLWISPPVETRDVLARLADSEPSQLTDAELDELPLADRGLIALADCVHVISVYPKSKTERLIQKRLADQRFPVASVFIVISTSMSLEQESEKTSRGKKLIALKQTLNQLLDCGAVGWLQSQRLHPEGLADLESKTQLDTYHPASGGEGNPPTFVPRFKLTCEHEASPQTWPYLSHCTRARMGAWPDQSQVGYYDSLLAINTAKDIPVSPLETLKRILMQQRLIASHELKRSKVPTVSLTEIPLRELLQRRHFQSHIGRWDWEPYGICIRQNWIEQQGGRRVQYRSPSRWPAIQPEDQPFFQVTHDPLTPDVTHWEIEKEWRFVGDIHLAEIPFESAFVFVPTEHEAREISSISRFPILVLA